MISREEIDNLAALARLELDEAQKNSLAKDLAEILGYVEQLKGAAVGEEAALSSQRPCNVWRDDGEPLPEAEAGLVEAAPKHDGRFIRVKKIL